MKKQNPMFIEMSINEPTVPKAQTLTQKDVWGEYDKKTRKMKSNGMIVARTNNICPVFKDKVPYKSVTVICLTSQYDEVVYWLEYVHGGGCTQKIKKLPNNKVAIRSDYQCW